MHKRDTNALTAPESAQPAFYLCNSGTAESIYNETGEQVSTIGEVWYEFLVT